MLYKLASVTAKATVLLFASSAFVVANAAPPKLSPELLRICADNNWWVKSGYCERHDAWNTSRCLCPTETTTGAGPEPLVVVKTPDKHERCDPKGFPLFTKIEKLEKIIEKHKDEHSSPVGAAFSSNDKPSFTRSSRQH